MTPSEEAVLGAALFAPEKVLEAGLTPEQFSDVTAAAIWRAMVSLAASGRVLDPVTLIGELGERYRRAVGHVASGTFAAANLDAYARSVAKDAKRRRLKAYLQNLDLDGDPDAVIGEALAGLLRMDRSEAIRDYDMRELMRAVTDEFESRWQRAQRGEVVGVPTGFHQIDHTLGGLHRSDLVVVAARPAVGKTAFLLSAATNAAHCGIRVGIVSAEMAAVQLGDRLVSAQAQVPAHKLRSGNLQSADYVKLTEAMRGLAGLPIRIMDPDVCRPADIVKQAHVWAAKGLDCLWIDYLTRLRSDASRDSRSREVGEMAFALKCLAKRLNIPVVALAQLSRKCEDRKDKRPMLSDLRDSGEIEQEADVVLFLYRDAVYDDAADPRAAEVLVEKNRHGPARVTVPMRFQSDRMVWEDPDAMRSS